MMGIKVLTAVMVLLLVLAPVSGSAQSKERQIIVPPNWQGAYDFGYAPAIRVGEWIIVSGIPASGEGSYEDKIRRMYERLTEMLEASGATIQDVIDVTTYHLEPSDSSEFRAEFERYMPIHKEFFGEHRPTWTAVGTTALLSGSAVVEMRGMALAGSSSGTRVVKRAGEPSEDEPAGP